MTNGNGDSDPELVRAYEQAHYTVSAPGGEVRIRVGRADPVVDELLRACGVTQGAFITAWNPGSEPLAETENAARHARLLAALAQQGFEYLDGAGSDPDGAWPAEQSLLVLGIEAEAAAALAREFGQNAYVWVARHQPALLVWVQ